MEDSTFANDDNDNFDDDVLLSPGGKSPICTAMTMPILIISLGVLSLTQMEPPRVSGELETKGNPRSCQ